MTAEETFWVIFDTCTKPDYYADVHKLLALPQGWVLRYDYRRKYLDDRADAAIFGEAGQPGKALLVYAQAGSYSRGGRVPDDRIPEGMLFCATRLGKILLIPTPDGDRAYLDIQVDGYPPPRSDALDAVIGDLLARGATPYRKWVALSSETEAYRSLEGSTKESNWVAIVDTLATPPAQFIGDTFWRLDSPSRPKESKHVVTEDLIKKRANAEEIYQVVSHFHLKDGHECLLSVTSHTPSESSGGAEERRYLEVESRSDRLRVVGSGRIELRRYSQDTLRVRAVNSDQAVRTTEKISLDTTPPRTDWPRGAAFELSFQVSKRLARIAVGVLLLGAAAGLGRAAKAVSGKPGFALAGIAALAGIGGLLALTGRLAKP